MNKIFSIIKEFGKRQSFQPNIFSFFLNNGLFIRWFLYRSIKMLAPQLTGKLMDFGCGRKPYKNLFTNVSEYIGIDIVVSGHNHLESEVDVFYDGKYIPFADETFDSVFCGEVVEHLFEVDAVLVEINRVLRRDGKALFTFPFAYQEHEKPYDFARYTSFAAKYLFEKHGFEIVAQQKTGHFVLVLHQLLINYIYAFFATKSRYLNTLLTILFITPFNILGLICFLFPRNKDLYFNNVLLVQKK
jgi:SAM-dependent methyltransferase